VRERPLFATMLTRRPSLPTRSYLTRPGQARRGCGPSDADAVARPILLPRWRTRMVPAFTVWPRNLHASIFGLESRPLRTTRRLSCAPLLGLLVRLGFLGARLAAPRPCLQPFPLFAADCGFGSGLHRLAFLVSAFACPRSSLRARASFKPPTARISIAVSRPAAPVHANPLLRLVAQVSILGPRGGPGS